MILDSNPLVPDNAGQRLDVRQFDATMTINREVSPSWRVLGFEWPHDLPCPTPGQFFTFRPRALESGDAGLLRRPLAFAAFSGGKAYALYQIRGIGTKALAAATEGSTFDIIGPLGNSFPLPLDGEIPILLGGGIGIGPLLFFHTALLSLKRPMAMNPKLFLGFRSSAFVPDFRTAGTDPGLAALSENLALAKIATDDGTRGYMGTVMDALCAEIAVMDKNARGLRHYYGCGPSPMLAALDSYASAEGSASHVSVEQWMACGVGACHGCVLPSTGGGYLRACADGPVFKGGDIRWKE
jgi:dihydroorotate dehydrogenase electron transfer subunit